MAAPATRRHETARLELGRALEEVLLGLSPDDRSLVLLSELEDFSAAEIGVELGLSAGAVRARLSRLRDRLVPELERFGGRRGLETLVERLLAT